jgi:hypothetical protein
MPSSILLDKHKYPNTCSCLSGPFISFTLDNGCVTRGNGRFKIIKQGIMYNLTRTIRRERRLLLRKFSNGITMKKLLERIMELLRLKGEKDILGALSSSSNITIQKDHWG